MFIKVMANYYDSSESIINVDNIDYITKTEDWDSKYNSIIHFKGGNTLRVKDWYSELEEKILK